MAIQNEPDDRESASAPLVVGEAAAGEILPWELIENGRYMPRRIRGSYRGRELG
jgi:hypothetical protein